MPRTRAPIGSWFPSRVVRSRRLYCNAKRPCASCEAQGRCRRRATLLEVGVVELFALEAVELLLFGRIGDAPEQLGGVDVHVPTGFVAVAKLVREDTDIHFLGFLDLNFELELLASSAAPPIMAGRISHGATLRTRLNRAKMPPSLWLSAFMVITTYLTVLVLEVCLQFGVRHVDSLGHPVICLGQITFMPSLYIQELFGTSGNFRQ